MPQLQDSSEDITSLSEPQIKIINNKYEQNKRKTSNSFTFSQHFNWMIILSIFIFGVLIALSTFVYNIIKQENYLKQKVMEFQAQFKDQNAKCKKLINNQKKGYQSQVEQQKLKCKLELKRYGIVNKQVNQNFENAQHLSQQIYTPTYNQLQILQAKKDLIIVAFAGRKLYLSILYKHLLKQLNEFYEWHLWINTRNEPDIEYFHQLALQNSWIKLIQLPQKYFNLDPVLKFKQFYKLDCQKNKIYLKLDDDILWLSPDFMQKMFTHRFKLIQHFTIISNIINSAIHMHIQQRMKIFKFNQQPIEYNCIGNGWKNADIGGEVHRQFIQSIQRQEVDKWKCFKQWEALGYERISINSMMYYSETIRGLRQVMDEIDDEVIYTMIYTKMYNKTNLIVGDPICVHGAFAEQRQHFQKNLTFIRSKYQQFADEL